MREKIAALLAYAETYPYKGCGDSYHSVNIGGEQFAGQRDCSQRLQPLMEELHGKSVADFGCNIGGMLHVLAADIRYGVGFDYNSKFVNAATAIARVNKTPHLDFFVFDFERENIQNINDLIFEKIDVCMVLSVARWIHKWKELISFCHSLSDTLIYEANGSNQAEQIKFLETLYDTKVITDKSMDDPRQHRRILLLCKKKDG